MLQTSRRFIIPAKHSLQKYKQTLKKSFPLQEEEPQSLRRIYYDTFDWKIHAHGGMLEAEIAQQGKAHLRWCDLRQGQLLGSLQVSPLPQFIWEIPNSPFQQRLAAIIDVRALLPQITLNSHLHPLKWLNPEGKTLLHVCLEENTLAPSHAAGSPSLGKSLHLMPVRGYPKPLAQVLAEITHLEEAQPGLLEQALVQLAIEPSRFSSKMRVHLTPDLPAEEAVQQIFQNLLQILRKNEDGLQKDLDAEFLHDFRVAVRKIRAGLGQMKRVLPPKPWARFRQDFAWLGQATSKLRDLDVYLLKFDSYKAALPAELQGDLEPLRTLLQGKKQQEHQQLVRVLNSRRYGKLMQDWEVFLQQPFFEKSPPPRASLPVLALANKRIGRVYRQVLQEGNRIQSNSPETALHDLRKTCKKLRYLMEFFQSLYPPKAIKSFIKGLKFLQENLGDFQDYQVQWSSLIAFGEEINAAQQGSPKTHLALGMLVQNLKNQQNEARQIFEERFAYFASGARQQQFKQLFEPHHAQKKKAQ